MKNYQNFLSEKFHFFCDKFSVYLNRYVFVMNCLVHAILMSTHDIHLHDKTVLKYP